MNFKRLKTKLATVPPGELFMEPLTPAISFHASETEGHITFSLHSGGAVKFKGVFDHTDDKGIKSFNEVMKVYMA